MKKLTKKYKKTLLYRSRRKQGTQKKRNGKRKIYHLVTLWDGDTEEVAQCQIPPITPPIIMDFNSNIVETLSFLEILRDKLGRKKPLSKSRQTWIKRRKRRPAMIKSYYDFGAIENLAIAPALVIAASYDRAKRMVGGTPPAVNYANWSQSAFQTFYEIGFFDLIGQKHNQNLVDEYNRKAVDEIKILKAISGFNANGLEQCSLEISTLLSFLTSDAGKVELYIPEINTAISEAMINVARHAYPEQYTRDSKYDTVNQWWITARADKAHSTLAIVVYDQGASIPGTLPLRHWFKEVVQDIVQNLIPGFKHTETYRKLDHEYINYSMKPGRSQTNEPERGLGLPQMQELLSRCNGGSLTIVSRSGLYKYDTNTGISKRALPIELEGTLIEWHLSFPAGNAL